MINRLYMNNFVKHMDKTIHFNEGLTGIIGPNESGKSLILEAIRFALFGTAALRGTAPKGLHIELDFLVRDLPYTVVRKGANPVLSGPDGAIATGTKPVNEAIIRILGYDLKVFDTANACTQGNVEELSNMKPAERKAMIDRTIGLDTLDMAIKHCGERGNALKSEAQGRLAMLVLPEEPVAPEGYVPSAEIPLAAAQADVKEMNTLLGFLAGQMPQPTSARPEGDAVPLLKQAREDHAELQQIEGFLSSAPRAPVPPAACSVTEEVVAHQEHRAEVLAFIRKTTVERDQIDPEQYTAAELDGRTALWEAYDLWVERKRLLAMGELCCPACSHRWPVAGNVPDAVEVPMPTMSRIEIAKHRGRIGNQVKWDALTAALDNQDVPADRSADLATWKQHQSEQEAFARASAAYTAYNAQVEGKQARRETIKDAPERITALAAQWEVQRQWERFDDFEAKAQPKRVRLEELKDAEARLTLLVNQMELAVPYEIALTNWLKAKEVYDRNVGIYNALVEKSDIYLKARVDMVELKTRVKTHLLPSLNKVASRVLSEMTGGVRYHVEIDEDFDIKIDGDAINLLSGSGKAVGNLAVRIALGHILTNRMFSLFMADEIDGSMDSVRAEYVAQSLQRLTGMVKQVILITHKRPEVDNLIELNT